MILKNKFDRIVAYGCSITSGFELADDVVYPTIKDEDREKYKLKQGIANYFDARTQAVVQEEYNRSWVGQLATQLGVELVNRAIPGGGCQSSIYFLEVDLGSKFIKDTDLIIVGQTDYRRWFWINNYGEAQTPTIGGTDVRWPSANFHRDFITHVSSEDSLLYNWYQGIKYLDMLSDRLDGRLLQQYCYETAKDTFYYEALKDFDSFIDPDFSFNNIVDWDDTESIHCFGHPKLEAHTQFAEYIANKVKNGIHS